MQSEIVTQLPRLELSNKPQLIISKKLKDQIDFLHKKVGSAEWSGELITREEGNIGDPDNWKIIAEEIYLVDIGSGAFTGYTVNEGAFKAADIIDMYEAYPGLIEGTHKNHHIHSHHNMASFFSGTDWSNLYDRGITCNYFLMLIVNFAGQYVAKVAFKAEQEQSPKTIKLSNNADNFGSLSLDGDIPKNVFCVMDCNIDMGFLEPLEQSFLDRYEAVKVIKPVTYGSTYGGSTTYQGKNFPETTKRWNNYTKKWEEDKEDQEEGTVEAGTKNFSKNRYSEIDDSKGRRYDIKDAKIFLNYLITDTITPDISDCMKTFSDLNLKMGTPEKAAWLDDFDSNLESYYKRFYPNETIQSYINMLKNVNTYLIYYKYNPLVDDIMDCLKAEINSKEFSVKRAEDIPAFGEPGLLWD